MTVITGLWAGLLAGLAMAAVMMGARAVGLSRLPMPRYLGTLVRRGEEQQSAPVMRGLLIHMAASVIFGVVYGLLFGIAWSYGSVLSAVTFGVAVGLVHWAIASVALTAAGVPDEAEMPSIGRFAYGYGAGAAIAFFVAHIVYGGVFGWLYALGTVG